MIPAIAQTNPALVPGVWRGRQMAAQRAEPTGLRELDRILPGGGLPVGAVTEFLCERNGIGEFGLLMPSIARLTQEGRRVAMVAPPYVPYAHGLAGHGVKLGHLVLISPETPNDALWAAEQTLRSGSFGMVVAWPARVGDRDLRRLQLAVETSGSVAVLYRPKRAAAQTSPAALRIVIGVSQDALKLRIIKNRGGQPTDIFLPAALHVSRFRETGTGWA